MTLKDARRALKWSQRRLDAKAGLPLGTVGDIEAGRNQSPSLHVACSLMAALHNAGLKGLTATEVFSMHETTAISTYGRGGRTARA